MSTHDDNAPTPPQMPTPDSTGITSGSSLNEMTSSPSPVMQWDTFMATIPWRNIMKWIVAGNPFYILSAVAMLYGISLVSHEPKLTSEEGQQLAFNFSSLQLYEWLLVVTAVLLGRRAIWYDSTLLVFLENLFVFAPFILIVQATLMDHHVTRLVCLAATVMVAGRFGWLRKRWPGAGNFPRFLAAAGALLLGLNLFLPLYFRQVLELGDETWEQFSDLVWLLLLPALALAANHLRHHAAPKLTHDMPRMAWFGPLLFGLWLTGTCVHLAAIDYVGSRSFQCWMVTPVVWAGLWTLSRRLADFAPHAGPAARQALFALPALVVPGALGSPYASLFLALTALNAARYYWVFRRENNALAGHLFLASCTALVAGLPAWMVNLVLPGCPRTQWIMLAIGAYLFGFACSSRRLRGTVGGALLAYWGTKLALTQAPGVEPLALQNALIFFLLHSLRWPTPLLFGRLALRLAVAFAWTAHSVVWGYVTNGAASGQVALAGALVVAFCIGWRLWRGIWPTWLITGAAVIVCISAPANYCYALIRITPAGYLVVLASFILFGLGTALALLKPRWQAARLSSEAPISL